MKGVFARTNPQLILLFELLQAHRTDLKRRKEVDIHYFLLFPGEPEANLPKYTVRVIWSGWTPTQNMQQIIDQPF